MPACGYFSQGREEGMMAGRMRGNAAIPQRLELLCCLKNTSWNGPAALDPTAIRLPLHSCRL